MKRNKWSRVAAVILAALLLWWLFWAILADEDMQQMDETNVEIMEEKNQEYIGEILEVMTEGFDRYAECYFGRSYMDSPDVDGKVFFAPGSRRPKYGEFVKVLIDDAMDCDLIGTMID